MQRDLVRDAAYPFGHARMAKFDFNKTKPSKMMFLVTIRSACLGGC
jgi:hypothetical protein